MENRERLLKQRKERYELEKLDKDIHDAKYYYNKTYYKENKDLLNQKRREKYKLKRDLLKPLQDDSKEKNYDQKYYEKNKEKILANKKIYYKEKMLINSI